MLFKLFCLVLMEANKGFKIVGYSTKASYFCIILLCDPKEGLELPLRYFSFKKENKWIVDAIYIFI